MRSELGYRSDPEYVRALIADPEGNDAEPTQSTLGHHFTPEEREDFELRMAVQREQSVIRDYAESQARDQYSGITNDQSRGAVITVGFTGDVERHREELERIFAYPDRLEVVPAPFSEDELRDYSDRFMDELADVAVDGGVVIGVTPRWQDGTLVASVQADADAATEGEAWERTAVEQLEELVSWGDEGPRWRRGKIRSGSPAAATPTTRRYAAASP